MTSIPHFDSFGDRLDWWLKHRGKTQKELAVAVGIGQPALNELIKGRSAEPRAGAFIKICRELGLRPEYLLWGEGAPEATSFAQLSGLEAQLVMLFRGLASDAQRDALLIDMNDAHNNSKTVKKATAADPFNAVKPSAHPPSKVPAAAKRSTKKTSVPHSG
ncbi:helix-turn-helix domain-containing protein [Comamonas sp. MYb396]|uniref:helix-turn-helix domain-containing protein n=1 Tax=Comamonas sp. MYb396 TaxID=2745302 RepID=UPI0030A188E8